MVTNHTSFVLSESDAPRKQKKTSRDIGHTTRLRIIVDVSEIRLTTENV